MHLSVKFCSCVKENLSNSVLSAVALLPVLALDLEGVHDVKLHHPSSSVATSNQ